MCPKFLVKHGIQKKNKKQTVSPQGWFRTRSHGMSAGVLPVTAILGRQSTNTHLSSFLTEQRRNQRALHQVIKEPHPPDQMLRSPVPMLAFTVST